MLGVIIGDMVGSIYEINNIKTTDFPFWDKDSRFTDDTVLTVAVAKAFMESRDLSHQEKKAALVKEMQFFGGLYPNCGFGQHFKEWLKEKNPQPYNSWGNGSAMRVASVGWLYNSLEETEEHAKLSAEVSHNHPCGIAGAQSVASAIFLLRNGKSKEQVKSYIHTKYNYDFSKTLDEIRPTYGFNQSCEGSVPQSFTAFFESENFEDCIGKAVSLGGDSDTIAAIAGGIAEAFYEIPLCHQKEALNRLEPPLLAVYKDFLKRRI
ncbi:MAG: ADP-ribosylglycohydrolase family protein [Clostridiales bacterium]